MQVDAVQKYLAMMNEIKNRTAVIDAFSDKKANALYRASTIESVYLQMRKILELIALGSLVANKEAYSQIHAKFAKHWHAGKIVADLEKINSDFYPSPIIQMPSTKPGVRMNWKPRQDDYLTKTDMVKLYERCGALMHARNPYRPEPDFGRYEEEIPLWREQIVNLLNAHVVMLAGATEIYLIQMDILGKYPTYMPFKLLRWE